MSFASMLRRLMQENGLGPTGTARLVPCDKAYISRLASGTQRPSRQVAKRLDEVFACQGRLASAAGFTPQPARPVSLGDPGDHGAALLASGLRAALLGYGHVALPEGPVDATADPVHVLERDVGSVLALYQASQYSQMLDALPGVVYGCQRAAVAYRGHEGRRAQAMLALSYQSAAVILPKLGDAVLAWVAAERGLLAAERSANPNVIASLLRSIAYVHQCCGRYETALQVTEDAARFMRASLEMSAPAGLSLYGTSFLAGAMAAARKGDKATVRAYLRQASDAAGRLGKDGNHLWTAFGPSNVTIHRVGTAVELGNTQAAIRLASCVRLAGLLPERRARHAFDVARAYRESGKPGEALTVLLEAERLVPEQVRSHAAGRQAAAELLRAARSRPGPELLAFARRAGAQEAGPVA
jgi:tetratricopeptide (TPR) repeat protein